MTTEKASEPESVDDGGVLYDAVTDYVREGYNQALREKKTAIGFLMILMQRLVTSSTRAIRTALERRLQVLKLPEGQLSLFPEDVGEQWAGLDSQEQMESILTSRLKGLKNERAEVELLLSAARRCEAKGPDVKAQALLDWIHTLQREEIGMAPLDRMLEGPKLARKAPSSDELRLAFSLRRTRTQRFSDGTVSIEGTRFELPSRLRTLRKPTMRYQRWDLSRAWVVDPGTDTVLATIRPLDRARNADGQRRTLEPLANVAECGVAVPHDDRDPIPALMHGYLSEYAATGLPPAYLPKEEALVDALHTGHDHHEEETDV